MKTLTLLRHAKSAWDDRIPRDFDRPINPRGNRGAQRMGREIAALGLSFDHVRASPALRVRETLTQVEAGAGQHWDVYWDQRIYLASAATLLELVHCLDDGIASALVVGHNPGLEDLLLLLAAPGGKLRDTAELKYPTAALAELQLDIAHWADAAPGGAALTRFIRPRDLDASLGPDD